MLLIFDCHYVCYTAAFALSQGLSYRGGRTEIIYGFVKQILTLSEKFDPDQIAFCWDSWRSDSKRVQLFPDYQKERAAKKAEVEDEDASQMKFAQFTIIRDSVLPDLGFSNIFMAKGYEADDIIATLVAGREPEQTVVISADNDLLQLLDNCCLYSLKKKQIMNRRIFQLEYRGLEPSDWPMIKAIGGCNSDEVPGVTRVGEKTAIDYMLMKKGPRPSKMTPTFQKIEASQDIIERNLSLVKLPFERCLTPRIRPNGLSIEKFRAFCEQFGMQSLLERQPLSSWAKLVSRIA